MPDWCQNILTISGSKKHISAFKNKAKAENTDLSMANFIPVPEELKKRKAPFRAEKDETEKQAQELAKSLIKKYSFNSWHRWCIGNWGTKWDIDAKLVGESDEWLEYSFESAWSPPVSWLKSVAKLYAKLSFQLKYEEKNGRFRGITKASNGKLISDEIIWL